MVRADDPGLMEQARGAMSVDPRNTGDISKFQWLRDPILGRCGLGVDWIR